MTSLQTQETRLRGTPICCGVAIGRPYLYRPVAERISTYSIPVKGLKKEITRYRRALKDSTEEIQSLLKQLEDEGAVDGATILDTHLQIIQDPSLTTEVEKNIRQEMKNAECIFSNAVKQMEKKFQNLKDQFFQERYADLLDVARRVLGHLNRENACNAPQIGASSIVFADELSPSDAARATGSGVKAFVTKRGGVTSHAAIVAKAKGVPFVTGIDLESVGDAKEVIVDGNAGDVILNPSGDTVKRYTRIQEELEIHYLGMKQASSLTAETYDGFDVQLSGNLDMVGELDTLKATGSAGVGLFRSEYIFLSKGDLPSEEEQFQIYKGLVERMRGLPVVIRTLDIGGDKLSQDQRQVRQVNPFMGGRAIRMMLQEKDVFKTQLRAILRAGAFGDVSIMFPMISGLKELREAKAEVESVRKELKQSSVKMAKNVRIGCMIEIPSAAIVCDILAKECDFLSIGTNDLVQYCLATDRGAPTGESHRTPTHPAVLRLIKMVVTEGLRHGVPVAVCGEMAADPKFTSLLLGLGVRELSVAARHIPVVKTAIRSISIVDASQFANNLLNLSSSEEIQHFLQVENCRRAV